MSSVLIRKGAQIMNQMDVWGQGGNLLPTVLLSILCILLCAAVGWLAFRKVRLP